MAAPYLEAARYRAGASRRACIRSAHAPHLKRRAPDNSQNQGRPPVAVPGGFARDRASDRSIVVFGSSAERVSQKSFRQIADKLTGLFQQNITQAGRSLELRPIGEHSRSIDGVAIAIAGSPPADGIKILQRKTHRVHARVAARADHIGAMLFHTLAHRHRLALRVLV